MAPGAVALATTLLAACNLILGNEPGSLLDVGGSGGAGGGGPDGDGGNAGEGSGGSGGATHAALTIVTAALPDATYNVAYTATIEAEGGSGGYSFELTGGRLPAGLLLEVDGMVSGRPTESGAYAFEVTVTDEAGDVSAETMNIEVLRKKWLAYVADKAVTGRQDLYVVDTSNELLAETNLSTGVQSSAVIAGVAFAPSGRQALAFVTDKTAAGSLELHYVDLSGASPAMPVKVSGAEQVAAADPTWSSDGRYIAYRDSEQNIYYSDVSSGEPTPAVPVGIGYLPRFISASLLTFTDVGYANLSYVRFEESGPSLPQTLNLAGSLQGARVVPGVGSGEIVAINAPLDPCYEQNYLVDFQAGTFTPVGVNTNSGVYFSPDLTMGALTNGDYALRFMSPPGGSDSPLLEVRREAAQNPFTVYTCSNGAWAPDSRLFASLDNPTGRPWIADFRGATPVVHDITEDTGGPASNLLFFRDDLLVYRSGGTLWSVSIGAAPGGPTALNSDPPTGSDTVSAYATYEQEWIAYIGSLTTTTVQELYIRRFDAAGTAAAERRVNGTLASEHSVADVEFSADGSALAYRVRAQSAYSLYFADLLTEATPRALAVFPSCSTQPCQHVRGVYFQP